MSSIREITPSTGVDDDDPEWEEVQRPTLNGTRRRLLAKYAVNNLESDQNFETVVREHEDAFEPAGGVQEGIVEELTSAYWSMRRLWALETAMMNQRLAETSSDDGELSRITVAFSSLTHSPEFALLSAYESRLQSRYYRSLKMLRALSANRKKLQSEYLE